MSDLRDEVYQLAVDEVINGDSPEHVAQEVAHALEDFIGVHVCQEDKSAWVQSLARLASELKECERRSNHAT